MKKKPKIIFILPSLVPGGAERVISFVSQNIDKNKFETSLLITGYSRDTSYDVSNVKVKYLNKSRVLFSIPSLVLFLFKEKPDIVLSSIGHLNSAIAMISFLFKKTKFIGREASIRSLRKEDNTNKNYYLSSFINTRFKKLDVLICQSDDMVKDMAENYDFPKDRIVKINNPISKISLLKPSGTSSSVRKFITVGRITEVKGHLRILKILSNLDEPFEYTMIGDGREDFKLELFNKAKELEVFDNITHIPFTTEVDNYIVKNDMFLQGSYVEGFPNALLESCVAGTPAIAFNVPGGTKEIVENNVNGFLVENEKEFLEKLMEKRKWEPLKIRESVYKKFNKEKILKEYEKLFIDILN